MTLASLMIINTWGDGSNRNFIKKKYGTDTWISLEDKTILSLCLRIIDNKLDLKKNQAFGSR